jgi:TetR/AcrR family transcriptional regulator, transcriptional repressor for nem operon
MDAVCALIWESSYGSTTIDQICERAGVKKGSFYYFFDSKADLAMAALEAEWQKHRAELDTIFSPTVPPLDRLRNYCDWSFGWQSEVRAKCGCVLGCPLFLLGAEVSTLDETLRRKVLEVLDRKRCYLETAIRDAHAAGLADAPDAAAKARMVFAYHEGLLTEARIQNSLQPLEERARGTLEMIGAKDGLAR